MTSQSFLIFPITLFIPVIIFFWHRSISHNLIPSYNYKHTSASTMFYFQLIYGSFRIGIFFIASYLLYHLHVYLSGGMGFSIVHGVYSLHSHWLVYLGPIALHVISIEIYIGDIIIYYLFHDRFNNYLANVNWYFIMRKHEYTIVYWLLITMPAAAASCLAVRWHAVFAPSEIRIHNIWKLHEWKGTYKDINCILTAPKYESPSGNIIVKRRFIIHFDNTMVYSTNEDLSFMSSIQTDALMEQISKISNVEISELPILKKKDRSVIANIICNSTSD